MLGWSAWALEENSPIATAINATRNIILHRPSSLQHVGLQVDQFAAWADVVEVNELDQEQYDAVTDVFAVPSACVLIRTSLFATIGGFDPGITRRGDDVSAACGQLAMPQVALFQLSC